jgi:hypothetical protein
MLTGEKYNAAQTISRYIGGVYVDRGFYGQKGAAVPYVPVAYGDQKRAMNALATYLFGVDAFNAPADLYQFLQRQRRGFNNFANTEDPKIHDRVLNMQRGIMNHMLHPIVLRRIVDSKMYGNTYSLAEYFGDMTNAMFKDDLKSNVNIFRQDEQMEYVRRLSDIIRRGNQDYDYPSQAMALHELKSIKNLLAKVKSVDALTQAHREAVLFEIEKATAVKG